MIAFDQSVHPSHLMKFFAFYSASFTSLPFCFQSLLLCINKTFVHDIFFSESPLNKDTWIIWACPLVDCIHQLRPCNNVRKRMEDWSNTYVSAVLVQLSSFPKNFVGNL